MSRKLLTYADEKKSIAGEIDLMPQYSGHKSNDRNGLDMELNGQGRQIYSNE